jgi:hypothetical protein
VQASDAELFEPLLELLDGLSRDAVLDGEIDRGLAGGQSIHEFHS